MTSVPDCVMLDGRTWISRAAIERQIGLSVQRQMNLYTARAQNGHPPSRRVGRFVYFEQEPVLAFYRKHLERKRSSLTRVTPGGNPDELLDVAGATQLLGYRSTSTIRGYLARGEHFPHPDHVEALPSGRQRRSWRRRTLLNFAADRTGPGPGRAATRMPQQPHLEDPAVPATNHIDTTT